MEEVSNNSSNIDEVEEIIRDATGAFYRFLDYIMNPENYSIDSIEYKFSDVIEKARTVASKLRSRGRDDEASRISAVIEALKYLRSMARSVASKHQTTYSDRERQKISI
ncbi:MAG: hypothetical protein QXY26_10305 [Ignisphaera sp.]